ncbi:hypothetical protein BC332_03762 [Capsicum chinense]|nr:hypothetical protein BC332_03762 [Capsicum chinense]
MLPLLLLTPKMWYRRIGEGSHITDDVSIVNNCLERIVTRQGCKLEMGKAFTTLQREEGDKIGMRAIGGENLKKWEKMQGAALGCEEKILVLVRLRPLSEKEIMRNEVSYWECINEITILYRNSLQERSGLPTAYTIATIFAYGQISSGNTYIMNEITKFTVTDIYDYMQKTIESSAREFIGKDNKTTLSASMNFVDLAGSERAS